MEIQKGAAIDNGSARGGVKVASLGLKLGREISATKKAGPFTPVPPWKLEDCPDLEDEREATPAPEVEPKRSSVSARKLGANLWEIQGLAEDSMSARRGSRIRRPRDEGKSVCDDGDGHEDQPQRAGSLRRQAIASLIKQYKLNEANVRALQPVSPASGTSSIEIAVLDQAITPSSSKEPRRRSRDVGYSLKTSTEMLKVLNRIWSLEEQNAANVSLVKALKVELEQARARIQELMQEQHEYHHDIDSLVKQVAEDKMMRKIKEQQKITAAVQAMRDELNDERRLRRRSESLHRKLGKDLSEVKAAFFEAIKDLEGQRKANELLEDLCDEFAEGIRDYEQEVRNLRQHSTGDCNSKVDLLILHISEAWLDERMQMKVAEAQGDLAEKTSVTERLRTEIEAFFHKKRSRVSKIDALPQTEPKRDNTSLCKSLESGHLNTATSAAQDADDDSVASDLHCFELNMSASNNAKQDRIKDNDLEQVEDLYTMRTGKFDATRKPKFPVKKLAHLNEKDQNSSTLHAQYTGHSEPSGDEGQYSITKMQQRPDSYFSQENGQNMKLKTRTQGINCTSDQAAVSCSEITECCVADNDGTFHTETSHNHLSWRDKLASVNEGGDPSVEFRHIASPVQKWNFRPQDLPVNESSESTVRLAQGIKENTLKAKLLEARREGRHARLKASKGSSVDAHRRQ